MATRHESLVAVGGSPAAVAAHDKEGWLSLFTPSAVVNDPVGSAPHRGPAQLSRFYDTFIAPNTIGFQVNHDVVCGASVLRDVTLAIEMSDRVRLFVPAHLRYTLTDELHIAGLYAYWELPAMVGQLRDQGWPAVAVAGRLSAGLLRNQGIAGAAGYARGFGGVGARAKRRTTALLAALAAGDDARAAFASSPVLRVGATTLHSPVALGEQLAGWRVGKTLAAGDVVSVTLTRDRAAAVAMFRFARGAVTEVTVFVDDNAPDEDLPC